jgi:hypothetical protein
MRRARRSHARQAPFILEEAEGQLWQGEPEERRRSKGEGPNGFGLARPRKRAKCSASGRLGSFLQARAYASSKLRASKLEADGVEADRERQPCEWLCKYAGSARTGAVRSAKVSSWASRGVRSTRLWHRMCVRRGSLPRERENHRVRGEVDIANPSGSIVLSHDPRHPATTTLRHRRALLVANLVHRGNSLSAYSLS